MPYKFQLLDLPPESWAQIWEWFARVLGALIGSAISIAYLLPSSKREAAMRFMTGLGVGLVFGTLTGHKLAAQLELEDILGPIETTLIGATTASLCAWWGLGILARAAARYTNRNDDKGKT